MSTVFADTYYYLALLSADDAAHPRAVELSGRLRSRIVTTDWVLMEIADALCQPRQRPLFPALLDQLRGDPDVVIVEANRDLFDRGVALYGSRADKSWSLTDCISFVVMQDRSLTDALTADHHFQQAGFVTLLK